MITTHKRTPKTVYDSFNPILIVSRMAAVCTITRNKNGIVLSKSMVVLQILVLVVSVCHLIFIPYAVIYIEKMPEITVEKSQASDGSLTSQKFITKMANIVLISITSIGVRITSLFKMHKMLPPLLNNIKNFDRDSNVRHSDFCWITALSVILLLVSWPYQFYSILIITTDSWIAFLMFYLNLYNNFTIISAEFQFVSICWILKSRYKRITVELEAMCCRNFVDLEDTIMVKLKKLKDSSKLFIDSFAKVNSLYNFQLLLILNALTLNTLFGLYFTIFGGFTKNSHKTSLNFQRVSNITNELIWSFYYFIRFVFVCIVAGNLTDKVNYSKILICNVLQRGYSRNVKEKLWEFLAYATSNKISFSACGFFKINIALISSAVSLGTTYLVILAQFQRRSD